MKGEFSNLKNQLYRVEVSVRAIYDESGQVTEYIGNVRDQEQQENIQKELKAQVNRLFEERKVWVSTYYELGKELLHYHNLWELTAFLVKDVRKLIGAEQCSLFLLNGNCLVLEDASGVERSQLGEEIYNPGEGMTGQVIQPGANFARPVRQNQVENSPNKVQAYYDRYRSLLPSGVVQHLLAAPLIGQQGPFGMLRVLNKVDAQGNLLRDGFSEEDEDKLVVISSMAAIAIENMRVLGETGKRYREIQALYEILARISKAHDDMDELPKIIVNEARQHLPNAEKASIHLVYGDELIPEVKSEQPQPDSSLTHMRKNEGIAGQAIIEKRTIYVPDCRLDPRYQDRADPNLVSLMVSPLIIQDEIIGTISIDSSHPDAFSDDDRNLLEALSYHAALAIDKARMYKIERERSEQAAALNRISLAINMKLSLRPLLQEVIAQISDIIPFNSISIQLSEGDNLKIFECKGFDDDDEVRQIKFSICDNKYPNAKVMHDLKSLILPDVRASHPHFIEEHEKYHSGKIRSWMGVPLIYRDHAIGMISFDSEQLDFYNDKLRGVAETIANTMSAAIANARLFEEKQQQVKNLDQLYNASGAINAQIDLPNVIKQVIEQVQILADADHIGLVLIDDSGHPYTGYESKQMGTALYKTVRMKGITQEVISTGKSRFFKNLTTYNHIDNPWILAHGFRSYGVLPVKQSNGKVTGVLYVHSFQPDGFENKEALLETFCNHAVAAIDNALFQEEIEKQGQILARALKASSRLLQLVRVDEVLKFAVTEGARIFGVENCSLYLADETDSLLSLKQATFTPEISEGPQTFSIDGPGLISEVARSGGDPVVLVNSAQRAAKPSHIFLHEVESYDAKMVGRLEDSKDRCVGVLELDTMQNGPWSERFTPFDRDLFKTFTSLIGIAIERAELTSQLNSQARKEAREMLSIDLHELEGTLLSTVLMRARIALLKYDSQDLSGARQEMETVVKSSKYVERSLSRIHNDLRDFDETEKGLVATLEELAQQRGIPIEKTSTERVGLPGDIEYALFKIGVEALNNIAKHADCALTSISLSKDGDTYTFQICDHGPGFDVEEIKREDKILGLNSMQRLAALIDATLKIDARDQEGTVVEVHGKIKPKGGEE